MLHRLIVAAVGACLATTAQAETISVTHWGDAFYGAPYAVAMEKGFFKQHGIDITGVLTSAGGGTSVRNTLAGDLPYGEVALSAAIEAINNGVPLTIIGSGAKSVADILWMTKKGSPITKFEDLIGKKVAFTSPGSVTNMLILMSMKAKGLAPDAFKLVPAGGIGANVSAVLNGAVDAAMSSEPIWTEQKDKLQVVFWPKDIMSPDMMQTVAVTTTEYLKIGAPKLRAILAGRRMGVDYIAAHPDEAAEIEARVLSGNPETYKQVFKHFLEIGYWSNGHIDVPAMNLMVEGLKIVGKQKGEVDWTKIVDGSLLPADLQK